jgi:uncharacterized membrane protein
MTTDKPEHLIRTELLIAYVLRYGVLLCLFVIGVGLAARLLFPGHEMASSEVIRSLVQGQSLESYRPPAGGALLHGALAFQPDTVIALGLVMLIALPILRVALTTFVFFFDRDWAFFGITLLVLTVLLSGVFLGRAL